MKKFILLVCGSFIFASSFGQMNFKWEKTDSIAKTKSQLYSATKMYIAKAWTSSKDVIQNDDKEAGVILIKGRNVQSFTIRLGLCPMKYIYNYSVTFKMKDGKYKITMDNVYCSSAIGGTDYASLRPLEPSDIIPYPFKTGGIISRNRAEQMMQSLKADLQVLVDNYLIYIKATDSTNDSW